MTAKRIVAAALFASVAVGGIAAAEAHSVRQCQQEIKWFTRLCKFGISLRLMGVCDTKKSIKWCADRKLHEEKFHK